MAIANAVYLHYLDRELVTAAARIPAPEDIIEITRALTLLTDARLYCGLSAIWENDQITAPVRGELEALLSNHELITVSSDATKGEFIESRRLAYRHDFARYPRYYTDAGSHFDWAVPTYLKTSGSTGPLASRLYRWAEELPRAVGTFNAAIFQIKDPVIKALTERGDRAITYSLFKEFTAGSDRPELVAARIKRQISNDFSVNNLEEFNGDITTGIVGLEVFDTISREFPLRDYSLLRLLGNAAGLSDVLTWIATPTSRWAEWIALRQTVEARLFAATLRWLLNALWIADSETRIPAALDRDEFFSWPEIRGRIRDRIWSAVRVMQKVPVDLSDAPLSTLVGAQLRLVAVAKEAGRRDRNLANVLEKTRSEIMLANVDAVVMTVNEVETQALRDALADAGFVGSLYMGRGGSYWLYGPIGGATIALVRSSMGSGGPGASALTASDAVAELSARALISIGVAFTLDDDDEIGTLLVAEQLAGYELVRLGEDASHERVIVERGGSDHGSPLLLSRFRDGGLEAIGVKVRVGQLLSGEKLVDNIEFIEELRLRFPEAIGGEMEGSGILSVGIRRNIHWIVAKAVCDYGHNKVADKAARQALAAEKSALALVHILRSGGLAQL